MYYEEKIIGKILHCRSDPDGMWIIKNGNKAMSVNHLLKLSGEERSDIFSLFCTHCGGSDPYCRCWDDS